MMSRNGALCSSPPKYDKIRKQVGSVKTVTSITCSIGEWVSRDERYVKKDVKRYFIG
jgi:hypothetical protein